MTGSVLNVVIKLTAVLLAVFLWFNVITQKQYENEYTLAVTGVELPTSLGAVTPFPDSLTVRVMAEGKRLLRDDWKTAGLRIKAGRLKRGINHLELNLETVALVRSEHVNLVDITGTTPIMVQLDRLDSILIPVASRLAVIPREGYMIIEGQGEISPLSTQVIGPALALQRIDSIDTEQKILDDVTESIHITLALIRPDDLDISMGHDSASIDVKVDKITRKRFDNISVSIGHLRSGRAIVDPDKVSVEVQGPASMIDSLSLDHIRVEVIPPGDKSGYAVPQISLPPNFKAADITPDSIRILVSP